MNAILLLYFFVLFSFSVGSTTGQISTLGPLDHESRSEYHLTLVAQDGTRTGSTPHRTTTLIVVRVTDVNDNRPILRPTTHTAFLTEGQTYNNFLIVQVSTSSLIPRLLPATLTELPVLYTSLMEFWKVAINHLPSGVYAFVLLA